MFCLSNAQFKHPADHQFKRHERVYDYFNRKVNRQYKLSIFYYVIILHVNAFSRFSPGQGLSFAADYIIIKINMFLGISLYFQQVASIFIHLTVNWFHLLNGQICNAI